MHNATVHFQLAVYHIISTLYHIACMSLIHLSCESKTWADVYTVRALCGGTSFPWHGTLKMFAGVMPFSRTGRCIGIYPVYDDSIRSIGSWNESEASIVTLLCQGCWLSLPSPFLAGLHRQWPREIRVHCSLGHSPPRPGDRTCGYSGNAFSCASLECALDCS